MKKWFLSQEKRKQYYWIIGVSFLIISVFLVPLVWNLGMMVLNFGVGDNNSWLGFWGGYLGAIVAIGGVYWQVNRTLQSEKEALYRQNRPYFILQYTNDYVRKRTDEEKYYYLTKSSGFVSEAEDFIRVSGLQHISFNMIQINNVSKKSMMAVRVVVTQDSDNKDRRKKFNINLIDIHDKVCLVFPEYVDDYIKASDENNGPTKNKGEFNFSNTKFIEALKEKLKDKGDFLSITKVEIYFTTELREKIKLTFELKNNCLKYVGKTLENKADEKNLKLLNSEYDVDKFEATYGLGRNSYLHKLNN